MISAALAIYFVAVLVVSLRKPVAIRSRWVQVVRFLLPSWRFFDELGELPILSLRQGAREDELGAWQPALASMSRSVRRIVLNADGNLALACESLVQTLMVDIAELKDATTASVSALESYRLVCNLVAARVDTACWQWKVDLLPPTGAREEALVSPVYAR